MLERIIALVQTVHHGIPKHFRGPAPLFWAFHAVRDYAHRLRADGSRMVPELPRLLAAAEELERAVGPIELVFAHNDLLAANLIDDGRRLWLVDWEYGAFNSPLFDLANLASNNELSGAAEGELLERYFGGPLDADRRRRYQAMACTSLLRETMWSMVSEIHLTVDFDYQAYTAEYLDRFDRAYAAFRAAD
jgi:thiamine kinase-like enzyme